MWKHDIVVVQVCQFYEHDCFRTTYSSTWKRWSGWAYEYLHSHGSDDDG